MIYVYFTWDGSTEVSMCICSMLSRDLVILFFSHSDNEADLFSTRDMSKQSTYLSSINHFGSGWWNALIEKKIVLKKYTRSFREKSRKYTSLIYLYKSKSCV